MGKDYYKILGVSKDADEQEIKKAFRNLARKYHPDINKEAGSEDKFKEINEAFSVLGDRSKREQYDMFGATASQQTGGGAGFGGFGQGNFSGFEDLFGEDFFSDLFGMNRRKRRQDSEQGEDLKVEITISLEDVYRGVAKDVEYYAYIDCSKCDGSGAKNKNSIETCETCNGSGQINRDVMLGPIRMRNSMECPACHGRGKFIRQRCDKCDGKGRLKEKIKLKVKIPKGINNDARIRLQGKGNSGRNNAPSGDLYIFVNVAEDDSFERYEENLLTTVDLSYSQAVLGDKIEISTFGGKVLLKIPPGTQPNTVFRLKDKGLPVMDSDNYGDLLVKIDIAVPAKPGKEETELIKKLAEHEGRKIKPHKGFFEKLKEHLR